MLITLLITAALAADGFYHPQDVVAASAAYTQTSATLRDGLAGVQPKLIANTVSLRRYRDLLDAHNAPKEDYADLVRLELAHAAQFREAQRTADAVIDAVDAATSAALDAALAKTPGLTECAAKLPASTRALPGIPSRMVDNPACTGTNHNGRLAAALDADATLLKAYADVRATAWPQIRLDVRPYPTDAPRHVHADDLLQALLAPAFKRINQVEDDALAETSEGGDPAALGPQHRQATARARALRAEFAAPTIAAARAWLTKAANKDGGGEIALCPRPASLGGCVGEDVTDALLAKLTSDKRVLKSVSR